MYKLLMVLVLCAGVFAQDFYVSLEGSDDNDGTKNQPFATLERARDAVRTHKDYHGWPDGGVKVWIREGKYSIKNPLEFAYRDSGLRGAPVVYRAYPSEIVRLQGGVDIDPEHFMPVTDPAILSRIVEKEAREHIVQVDLKSLGITNFGQMSARGFRRPYVNPGLELFFDGQAMTIARWPDEGFVPIGRVIDPGSRPRDGDYENRGGTFMFNYDRADYWTQADDIYVSGNWHAPFADDTLKVAEIDTDARTIRLAYSHLYSIRSGRDYCNYFVLNLLEEISIPGEYYVDRNTGILYFYPPSDIAGAEISVTLLEEPMIVLDGASHVHFENLIIELTRGIGVYIEGGESNLVAGCTLRNIGNVAVVMGRGIKLDTINRHEFTGEPMSRQLGSWHNHLYKNTTFDRKAGRNHGVLSCDIYNIGAGGVSMSGGNRITLEPGNNYVKNSRIYNFNRLDRSYKSAVNVDGVGNRIVHNHIFDAPDMAIYLHGNDHVIEYNHIHHVMLESGEGGWFYMGRDPSELGNVIRYNFVHHVGVLDDGSEGDRTEGSAGIYIDDFACGLKVYQNVFYKVAKERGAVMINGGHDNVIENNIFIECRYALYASALFKGWAKYMLDWFNPGGLYRNRLEEVNYRVPPYSVRYPQLPSYMDDKTPEQPKRNFMRNNVYVDCGQVYRWNEDPDITLVGNFETTSDPGFVDRERLNFQLRDDSVVYEKIPEFRRIPFEKIGLHVDHYRTHIEPYSYDRGRRSGMDIPNLNAKVDIAKLMYVDPQGTVTLVMDVFDSFASGEVTDIKILDGYTIDVRWLDGALARVVINSQKSGEITFRYQNKEVVLATEPEGRYGLDANLKDIWF